MFLTCWICFMCPYSTPLVWYRSKISCLYWTWFKHRRIKCRPTSGGIRGHSSRSMFYDINNGLGKDTICMHLKDKDEHMWTFSRDGPTLLLSLKQGKQKIKRPCMMFCSPPSTMMSIVLNEKWELCDVGSNSRKTSVALKANKYMSSLFFKKEVAPIMCI
jgi:hypothetical protein